MRHQKKTIKLGRSQAHRDALLANQTISLITENRIKTTLAKAKAVRPFAEKLVTLGKKNTLHARRTALAILRHNETAVHTLFAEIAPRCAGRRGGYIRIVKLGNRNSDAAPMAYLEWVDAESGTTEETSATTTKAKSKSTATAKKSAKAGDDAEAAPKAAKAKASAPAAAEAPEGEASAETDEKKPARKPRAKKDAAE